jgi:hypothetical protein
MPPTALAAHTATETSVRAAICAVVAMSSRSLAGRRSKRSNQSKLTRYRQSGQLPARALAEVAPRGAATSITLVTWFDRMPPGSVGDLVLETDDLDRDVVTLAGRGVPFGGDVQQAPWAGT